MILFVAVKPMAASTFDVDSMCRVYDSAPRTPIEGLWQWADGARIQPGTIAGTASQTATQGSYDLTLMTKVKKDGTLSRPKHYVAKIDDSDMIKLSPYEKGYKADWWRLLPHIFRVRIQSVDTRPAGLDGGQRLYPAPQYDHFEPIAL
jgi:hypothetical protein